MKPITITLRRIMGCKPCYDPIERGIFENDHDLDAPITFRWLAERIPSCDVVWCFSNLPDEHDPLKRHFAVDCAERVKYLMQDERSINALVVARKYAFGEASNEELLATRNAAETAVAEAVARAAWAAARAAQAATRPAWAATRAAWAAAWAEQAAAWAERDAAWVAEQQWQLQRILELTDAGAWSPIKEGK
jgi:hypothetical protein